MTVQELQLALRGLDPEFPVFLGPMGAGGPIPKNGREAIEVLLYSDFVAISPSPPLTDEQLYNAFYDAA